MPDGRCPAITADDDALRDALAVANIPTLLLVLRQLTGDPAWFEPPYRPTRTIAMNDNDTGGLEPTRQVEVRDAAHRVLAQVRDGERLVPPGPVGPDLVDALSRSLGEAVPVEYAEAMAEEAGFTPRPVFAVSSDPLERDLRVVVVGAGISGLCAAVALRRLGVCFTVLERAADLGGTWWENDYPGSGVDTPSHLYSFSFAPNPGWSRYYARQPEILEYLRRVARDEGIYPKIRFETEVVSAIWDEATATWRIRTRGRSGAIDEQVADVLISSVGQLNTPVVPDLPGLADFPGPAFHTARWDHSVSLRGKRVGVVGTGASAMQAVPAITDEAASVVVFQRSPQWISPNPNYLREVDPRTRLLMEQVPYYRAWYRLRLMWMFQDKLHPTLQKDPAWAHQERSINAVNDRHREFFTDYLRSQLEGRPDLVAKTLPDYPPYGKRMLLDSGWFAALRRDDVELVTSGVAEVDGAVVVTEDGGRYDVDVLVFATGFSARRMMHPMDVRGRSRVPLRMQWGADDAWAHLGITVPDFPNMFLLYGPNTNLGHGGSTMFHAECQMTYISGLLRAIARPGVVAVEVRREVCDDYVARVDAAHERMIWTHPGMRNWYRNAAGRVVTNTPWRLIDYWSMTREPDLEGYLLTEVPGEQEPLTGEARA